MDEQIDEAKLAVKRVMSALYPEIEEVSVTDDGIVSAIAYYTPEREHTGAPGWVQGGLSATVIDFVSARVAKVALESSVATGTLDIRYRQPVLITGGPYRIEGTTEKRYSRSVRVHTKIPALSGFRWSKRTASSWRLPASEVLQRFAFAETGQFVLVVSNEGTDCVGAGPCILAERPTNCLSDEELGAFTTHHSVGEQPVGIGPLFEHELMEDGGSSDPNVVRLDPFVHLGG